MVDDDAARTTEGAHREIRGRDLVLLIMTAGYFLVLLDVTIINVTLPSIRGALGAGVSELQWVVDGYAVALASLLLVGGSIGDLYGHKRIVLTGLALFGVASLACGLAPTPGALIGARVIQGVGAAVLLPGTLAIISRAYGRSVSGPRLGAWLCPRDRCWAGCSLKPPVGEASFSSTCRWSPSRW
jgi:DHA2 family methylenomycin A resistance protein-like MFS transporter